tara:strand:+ start:744 stop:1001 length:258 start_codon:yes stop_codon:yes gene_type:complete
LISYKIYCYLLVWQLYWALCLFTIGLGNANLSATKEKLKALKERREELVGEYSRLVLVLSSMQDQIADIDGDIRMLKNEQKKRSS